MLDYVVAFKHSRDESPNFRPGKKRIRVFLSQTSFGQLIQLIVQLYNFKLYALKRCQRKIGEIVSTL